MITLTGLDGANKLLGGRITAALGALTALTTLGLSRNDLSGCMPNQLRALATAIAAAGGTHDRAQLPQTSGDETPPPAPTELAAATVSRTGLTLS